MMISSKNFEERNNTQIKKLKFTHTIKKRIGNKDLDFIQEPQHRTCISF
jgi:hypothetical protein